MPETKTCFVIMPTGDPFDVMFEDAVQPAVEEAGVSCVHIDKIPDAGHKVEDVVKNIHQAEVVIVDLTQNTPEFLYELGLTHGLLNNVIVITQDPEKLLFDLRDYQVLHYHTRLRGDRELKDQLVQRIGSLESLKKRTNPLFTYLKEDDLPIPAERFRALQAEFQTASNELKALRESNEDLEDAQRERARMQSRLTTLEDERAEMETRLADCEQTKRVFQKETSRLEEELKRRDATEPELHRIKGAYQAMVDLLQPAFGEGIRSMEPEDVVDELRGAMDQNQAKIDQDRQGRPRIKFTPKDD